MSSRSKKKHVGEWGDWSDWSWNDVRKCLQRTRQHSDGRVNYQYGQTPARNVPRTEGPVEGFYGTGDENMSTSSVQYNELSSGSPVEYAYGSDAQFDSTRAVNPDSAQVYSSGSNEYQNQNYSQVPSTTGEYAASGGSYQRQPADDISEVRQGIQNMTFGDAQPSYPYDTTGYPSTTGNEPMNVSLIKSSQNFAKPDVFRQPARSGSTYSPNPFPPPKPNPEQKKNTKKREVPTNLPNITTVDQSTKEEPLDPAYRVCNSSEFKKLRVFKILWSEPAGEAGNHTVPSEAALVGSKFGESAYNSIRRFVIVKAREGHCLCLPILTYGRQGTAKPGVKPDDHAIIFVGDKAPKELKDETKLKKKAIKMTPESPRDKLVVESRINYSKLYTVEHNVKVNFIGKIHPDFKGPFEVDFKRTFDLE